LKDTKTSNNISGSDSNDNFDYDSCPELSETRMKELEELAINARKDSNLDANNEELLEKANRLEQTLNRGLFTTKLRSGNSVSWFGWKPNYCRLLDLTKYGKIYAKHQVSMPLRRTI
jgi:hypothetical protein